MTVDVWLFARLSDAALHMVAMQSGWPWAARNVSEDAGSRGGSRVTVGLS